MKQNRVLNLTVLVPVGTRTVIPLSCVEASRWRPVSRHFASVPRVQFAEGRGQKMRDVSEWLIASRSRRSDQHAVRSRIAEKAERFAVNSDTEP